MPRRRAKYGAKPTIVDGIHFASKKEAARYGELKLLQAAGEIADLICHPRYSLTANSIPVAKYEADFSYFDVNTGETVVEDVKGYKKNPVYRLKKKMMKAIYGIEVLET